MKLKCGKPKIAGALIFSHKGYWYISDGVKQWVTYPKAKNSCYSIKRWYGITVKNIFIGIIVTKLEKRP